MRILGMMAMMMVLNAGLASAATIDLTDGRAVTGDIIKQDNKSLQISVDGVTMTYYADEIKDIDGKPMAAGQPKPAGEVVSPIPALQPEVNTPSSAAIAPSEVAANPVSVPASTSAESAIDPQKKVLILKFIDVFGTRQALTSNFEMMLKQIKKEKPDEAQKIRERVKIDEIIERLLPVYDRNFTSGDLQAFIDFYGSPEGQKLLHTIPVLMKESIVESVKYMRDKFPEVNKEK